MKKIEKSSLDKIKWFGRAFMIMLCSCINNSILNQNAIILIKIFDHK